MAGGRAVTAVLALAVVAAGVVTATRTTAGTATAQEVPDLPAEEAAAAADVVELGPDYNSGKPVPIDLDSAPETVTVRPPARGRTLAAAPATGTRRSWPSLDTRQGLYLKEYTLRGAGDRVEVWVASGADTTSTGLRFPGDDCRNGPRTEVSDAQVAHIVREFGATVLPLSSQVFSVAPGRDGGLATLPVVMGLPRDYYVGDRDSTVLLVDNVRDENFYDRGNQNERNFVAGFFYSQISDYTDRNVVTLDGFDWLHRTAGTPPNEPTTDPCTNAPARPWFTESILAHEYQHLLHEAVDPDETVWLNEGLSDWAQTLTGYVDPSTPVTQPGWDAHVQCLLGGLGVATPANPRPREAGGPENSLTLWEDQGPDESLCDYGAAYTFMEYLHGRFGRPFMTALHRDGRRGLTSLQHQLNLAAPGTTVPQVLHDWAAMLALDAELDGNGSLLKYGLLADLPGLPLPELELPVDRLRTPTLSAGIRWETRHAYDTPGAPPNGTDFVRLRAADGRPLRPNEVRSLRFDGGETHVPRPAEWTVATTAPGQPGNAALASGTGADLDRAIVRQVTVPTGAPTLTFDTNLQIEDGWDFGFVQVSTDGGATWATLANDRTTVNNDPSAIPGVRGLPGLTGDSGGWIRTSFDLSPYAGKNVLLGFRYVSDHTIHRPGWWIDDVTVGGVAVSDGSSLSGWQSATQVRPTPVAGYSVQVVAFSSSDATTPASVGRFALDGAFAAVPAFGELRFLLRDSRLDTVGVLVTAHDPSEREVGYVPYTLTVNGVVQPGG